VEKIRASERGGLIKMPEKRGLQPGDKVRVIGGSFVGHIGVLAMLGPKQRQQILLDLLGRQVKIDLDSRDTEPIQHIV
jgi:transcription antitermination factor NusG